MRRGPGYREGDHAVLGFYVVGTDVLGNATGFARRHFGGADVVQQRGFTVVNVAHDGHDRRARLGRSARITVAHQRFFQLVFTAQDNFVAHLFGNQLCGFRSITRLMVAMAPSFIITLMT